MKLEPLGATADLPALAAELSPGFGGDDASARELLKQTLALLTGDPRPAPWGAYLARSEGATVGTCAFKAAPDSEGVVEIAYMTFPAHERRGHATAMAAELVGIARVAGARTVIAHTLREDNGSTRCLARNAFAMTGEVIDPEDGPVWRWELPLGR